MLKASLLIVSFVLALLSVLPLAAESDAVQWQVYADFDSELTLPDDSGADPAWTFRQNHASVFLSYHPGPEIGIQADILRPDELFQFIVGMPWGTASMGRVLIPFGAFDIHHIYGGHPDDGTFLPRLWSDWGVIYTPPTWEFLTLDLFLTNGMDPAGFQTGQVDPRIYASATDANASKAIGLRLKAVPLTNLTLVWSGSWDSASFSSPLDEALGMTGADIAYEFEAWMVRAGAILQAIRGESSYQRWADYAEIQWKLTWDLTLKLRAGQMDTHTSWITAEDQGNVNAGLIWKTDFADFALMYFRNFTLANPDEVGLASNYQQVLIKCLVAP